MIISELPNPDLFNDTPSPNLRNEVICTSTNAKYYYPSHTTPHLLVANFNNTGNYEVNRRPAAINDKVFYFLNAGDKLEINFKRKASLQTLLILFSDEFVKSWINYKYTGATSLLDNGTATSAYGWDIPNIPFEYNADIINQLNRIKAGLQREDSDAILFGLLESFWELKEGVMCNLDCIDVKKKSTREEIYRRLLAAKLFMHDNFTNSPTINQIALEACLDKFHFLKLFKSLYGITPHQYLVKLKLDHAHSLLVTGRYTVLQACQIIGFESQGTFTNLFRRFYGVPPSKLSKAPKQ